MDQPVTSHALARWTARAARTSRTSLAGLLAGAVAVAVMATDCGPSTSSDEPDFGPDPLPPSSSSPSSSSPSPSSSPGAPSRAGALPASPLLPDTAVNPRLLRRFKPLRASLEREGFPRSAELIDLGRLLFFETRLSHNSVQSCNSCHSLEHYGVDHEPTSRGARGARGTRNSPSVFHAAGHLAAFWDGHAANVEEQFAYPLLGAREMGMRDRSSVVAALAAIPGYVTAFAAAFPGEVQPITFDNVGRALGAFERGLVTPSRWDQYLMGDSTALTPNEIKGLRLFTSLGCMTCHTGELLGGSSFQKVGLAEPWPNQADQGRYQVTRLETDRMAFKVPSLRNVAMTGPYFHDGSVPDLSTAVRMMARYQLGEELTPTSVAELVAWLQALTGKLPAAYIAPPLLPPNDAATQTMANK